MPKSLWKRKRLIARRARHATKRKLTRHVWTRKTASAFSFYGPIGKLLRARAARMGYLL